MSKLACEFGVLASGGVVYGVMRGEEEGKEEEEV